MCGTYYPVYEMYIKITLLLISKNSYWCGGNGFVFLSLSKWCLIICSNDSITNTSENKSNNVPTDKRICNVNSAQRPRRTSLHNNKSGVFIQILRSKLTRHLGKHTHTHTFGSRIAGNCGRIGAIGSSPSNGLKPNL